MELKATLKVCLGAAFAVFAVAAMTVNAQAEGKMATPQLLVSNCFNCHGYLGDSVGVIDELSSLPERRIVKKMLDFKSGEKPSTIMNRIAKGYSDSEIEAMAKYLAAANAK